MNIVNDGHCQLVGRDHRHIAFYVSWFWRKILPGTGKQGWYPQADVLRRVLFLSRSINSVPMRAKPTMPHANRDPGS